MGIRDIFKSKRKTEEFKELNAQSVLKRAAEFYGQTMEEGDKLLAELHGVCEGLSERDVTLLHAANDALIPAPAHLTGRLEILRRINMQAERRLAEAGVDPKTVEAGMGDNEAAALVLLQRQSWWSEFIANVRAEKSIRTADDIGRWANATKKLAPYIYEAGRMYQTPDDYRKDGPITHWTWRVDLSAGTVESTIAYEYDECINRLADKVIGLSFALWEGRDTNEEIVQTLQDRESIDWSMVAFEYMMCFQHLIDRYAFGLYGAEFRDDVMDSLYEALVRKYAETGCVLADRLEEFRAVFISTLNERNAEYGDYNLEKAISDEFSVGGKRECMQSDERQKRFLTIHVNIDASNQDNADKILKDTLLWEFGKRIANIIGGTNTVRVSAYVRNYAITALLVIEPAKELNQLKDLIDATNVP